MMSSIDAFAWIGLFVPFVAAGFVLLALRYPVTFNAVMSVLKVLFAGRGGFAPEGAPNRNDTRDGR